MADNPVESTSRAVGTAFGTVSTVLVFLICCFCGGCFMFGYGTGVGTGTNRMIKDVKGGEKEDWYKSSENEKQERKHKAKKQEELEDRLGGLGE